MCATASFINQTAVTGGDAAGPEELTWKAPHMNRSTLATTAGGAFIALAVGFPAVAQAAPSGVGSAQDTVNELENNGFKVVLNKMGAGPLDHCTVDWVRPGETVTRPVQNGTELVNQIVYQTVYFDGQVLTTAQNR